jgi:hypothetical protein
MYRFGLCHFLAKVGFGKNDEDAKMMAIQLCSATNAASQCKVRPFHSICQ